MKRKEFTLTGLKCSECHNAVVWDKEKGDTVGMTCCCYSTPWVVGDGIPPEEPHTKVTVVE